MQLIGLTNYDALLNLIYREDGNAYLLMCTMLIGFYAHLWFKDYPDRSKYYWSLITLYLVTLCFYVDSTVINPLATLAVGFMIAFTSPSMLALAAVTNLIVPESFFVSLHIYMMIYSTKIGIDIDAYTNDKKLYHAVVLGTPAIAIIIYVVRIVANT